MEAKRTRQQVIDWLKAAEKRQQDWQQEVKKRCDTPCLSPCDTDARNTAEPTLLCALCALDL